MSTIKNSPSVDDIADALSENYWIYLDSGDDGGVFDYELVELNSKDENSFDVVLRVYSSWDDVLNSSPEDIEVCPYNFYFVVEFDDAAGRWRVPADCDVGPGDLDTVKLEDLPDSDVRIQHLIGRQLGYWGEEDFAEIDLEGVAASMRPHLELYIKNLKEG